MLKETQSPRIEVVEQSIEPGEEGPQSNRVQVVDGSPKEAKEHKMRIKIGGKAHDFPPKE